jgi:hypothetical protein
MNTTHQSENNPSTSGGTGTQHSGGQSTAGIGKSENSMTENMGLSGRREAREHTEGTIAKTIEDQTAKLPSDTFLWAAVGGMAVSAVMEFTGHKDKSRFFGQWVAPLLLFGVYNKLVKVAGSDRRSEGRLH